MPSALATLSVVNIPESLTRSKTFRETNMASRVISKGPAFFERRTSEISERFFGSRRGTLDFSSTRFGCEALPTGASWGKVSSGRPVPYISTVDRSNGFAVGATVSSASLLPFVCDMRPSPGLSWSIRPSSPGSKSIRWYTENWAHGPASICITPPMPNAKFPDVAFCPG